MMAIARLLISCCLLLSAAAAFAGDPHPPPLNVSFLAQPSPIVQNGATRLFYEMLITNFSKNAYVLDGIDAKAGDTQSKISGSALSPLIVHLGVAAPTDDSAARSIDGGRSAIVFLTLDFGKSPAPDTIAHTLHVLANKDEPHDVVRRLMEPLPSGSYLVMAHAASDIAAGMAAGAEQYNEWVSADITPRDRGQVARYFDGLEMVGPGLVPIAQWWGTEGDRGLQAYCGVGKKP